MGSCCLDYLAQVAAFPSPDDKLRTESFETQGGGNCANALTAAARLGLTPWLVSKIGDDGMGDQMLQELNADGVRTDHVLRAAGSPSPFTYIIVDRQGGTRTCIHTPSAPLEPQELQPHHDAILEGASLAYFDGRLTEAAIPLAKAARRSGIPVLVEAERVRPNLELLLAEADYVSTSAKFPQAWTGEEKLGDALVAMLQRLPLLKWSFTTLGAQGAVLLQRVPPDVATEKAELGDLLATMLKEVGLQIDRGPQEAACTSANGTQIRDATVLELPAAYSFTIPDSDDAESSGRAEAAAAEEARRNAAGMDASGYWMDSPAHRQQPSAHLPADFPPLISARVIVSSAAQIPKDKVRDTTGAGDASVGSLLYGICTGLSLPAMMRLAAVVAAAKCTDYGARTALPHSADLRADLLFKAQSSQQ